MDEQVRADKFLWAVRVFKTRTEAAEACRGNKVRVNGAVAKPAREIAPGDVITVRKQSVTYTYKVIRTLGNRVGAALVPDYLLNLTPEDELAKLHAPVETFFLQRDRGTGRPTKKERRTLDALLDEMGEED